MMKICQDGLRLLIQWEGVRLDAYQCSAEKWTIGVGCTHYGDGRQVKKGDRIEASEVMPLLLRVLEEYEECVRQAMVGVAVTQHQFSAMVVLCFNIGKAAFLESSVCSAMQQGRPDLAALGFEAHTGATSKAVHKEALNDPAFAELIGRDEKGRPRWKGKTGVIGVGYMRRLEGLLRRHLCTSVLFAGHDWSRSCASVRLIVQPPSANIWDPNSKRGARWKERIAHATTHADVLRDSPPLEPAPWEIDWDNLPAPAPDWHPTQEWIDDIEDFDLTVDPVVVIEQFTYEEPPVQAPPVPPAPQPTPAPKPSVPAIYVPAGEVGVTVKDMARSRRFWGLFLIIVGRIGMAFGIPTGAVTALNDPVVSELMIPFLIMGGSYAVERVGDFIQDRGRKGATALLK